jgi:hypothetical protein
VIVPVYVPATAELGTLTVTVGSHDAESFPTIADAENAVREAFRSWSFADVSCPGVKVAVPDVALAGPDQ